MFVLQSITHLATERNLLNFVCMLPYYLQRNVYCVEGSELLNILHDVFISIGTFAIARDVLMLTN
jgi:hypothetical protein